MGKLFTLWIPVFLFVFTLLLYILDKVVSQNGILNFSELKFHQIGIVIVVFTLFVANQLFTTQRPYGRFKSFENRRKKILDKFSKTILNKYEFIDLRIEVLIVVRKIVACREQNPKYVDRIKWKWFSKNFISAWRSENMLLHHSPKLNLSCSQGLAGYVIDKGAIHMADLSTPEVESFNLTKKQKEQLKDVKFMMCAAIADYNNQDFGKETKFIGVVCFSSISDEAKFIAQNLKQSDMLAVEIENFSTVCSLII